MEFLNLENIAENTDFIFLMLQLEFSLTFVTGNYKNVFLDLENIEAKCLALALQDAKILRLFVKLALIDESYSITCNHLN